MSKFTIKAVSLKILLEEFGNSAFGGQGEVATDAITLKYCYCVLPQAHRIRVQPSNFVRLTVNAMAAISFEN
jgi:hypothetical protein